MENHSAGIAIREASVNTPEVNDVAKAVAENGPFVANNIVPTAWMVVVAILGGLVSFYQKVKAGKARPLNITELVGEMMTSALVGLITFWICKAYNVNEYLTASGVAISGHMGARAIFIAEQAVEKFSTQWVNRRAQADSADQQENQK